jgi:hypothetical protein
LQFCVSLDVPVNLFDSLVVPTKYASSPDHVGLMPRSKEQQFSVATLTALKNETAVRLLLVA